MIVVKQRESSFELLRLISQYMIVIGHILQVIVIPTVGEPFFKAIMFPLHVAVPCFVMISGYFGIKASVKGFINLIKFVVILYVPMLIAKMIIMGGGLNDFLSIIFPVSRTNTWFVRTYLWLFLFSPLVNKALEHSSFQQKVLYTFMLFVIGNYAGTIGNDISLLEGKNIVTFLFYYLLGHLLSQTNNLWKKWDRRKLLFIYIISNTLIVLLESCWGNNRLFNTAFEFCFIRYNSPLLWLNAILTFIIITSIPVKSQIINKTAKSCLSIYLLHCSFVSWMFVKPVMLHIISISCSTFSTFVFTCLLALIVVMVCIAIHFLLSPIWSAFDKLGLYLQNREVRLRSHIFRALDNSKNKLT